MKKCLLCYDNIDNLELDFHTKCSKRFFGTNIPPIADFNISDINNLAKENINQKLTIPGVQKKISLSINKSNGDDTKRLTIIGFMGDYILKPQTDEYANLPENESLTMMLANLFGIDTVPNSLIKLKSGELAYITRRIDRIKHQKIPMEDMAQLSGRLTEEKYRGSLETIAKAINNYSSNAGLDLVKFYEMNLFSFICGNSDMHLKNYSMIYQNEMYILSPAYDLISTRLVIPEKFDSEEFALTMNGRKSKFSKSDFFQFADKLAISSIVVEKIFKRFAQSMPKAFDIVDKSFLPDNYKQRYKDILLERSKRIEL